MLSALHYISVLLSCPYVMARKLAKLAGKLLSMKYVIGNIVRLKTSSLYKCIDGRSSWDAQFNILNHQGVLDKVFFWKNNFVTLNL